MAKPPQADVKPCCIVPEATCFVNRGWVLKIGRVARGELQNAAADFRRSTRPSVRAPARGNQSVNGLAEATGSRQTVDR